jgi:hypothetical protein
VTGVLLIGAVTVWYFFFHKRTPATPEGERATAQTTATNYGLACRQDGGDGLATVTCW